MLSEYLGSTIEVSRILRDASGSGDDHSSPITLDVSPGLIIALGELLHLGSRRKN